ncbi:MAG: GAF domain-containing protein [Gemmatimonadetes bacterium]|nr:GAF domain-containing protein [Gemmatimonadota bacterium]
MNGEVPARAAIPDPVKVALDEFGKTFDLDVDLWTSLNENGGRVHLYPDDGASERRPSEGAVIETFTPRHGPALELEVRSRGPRGPHDQRPEAVAAVLRSVVENTYDFAQEIRFFTHELSERYEEINLLYSISETLGSILRLDAAARVILGEVCDVLGALRGSLWVYDPDRDVLHLTASVGEGMEGPISPDDPDRVTAQVFREGRSMIVMRYGTRGVGAAAGEGGEPETFLSVPIRYTPPAGEARTVGVINLIGRRHGGRFTASDQKLLSAIASQVGATLENNRLIQESLARERLTREMELAHNLQMKLLPDVARFEGARAAARVEPAESVGGDFYHLLKLPEGRIGVMMGDVSSHGFSAALIMAFAISAATIYASEFATPAKVLRHMDDALHHELETTEMYLTLFYAVLDPAQRRVLFTNAGHPHAFMVHGDGSSTRMDATDQPIGIAGDDAYGQSEIPWDPDTDLLFCFTDGLSDSVDLADKETGEERVLREVARLRDRSPEEIVEALFDLKADSRTDIPADDRTALILRALPA